VLSAGPTIVNAVPPCDEAAQANALVITWLRAKKSHSGDH
jgi:hypothetical protein